MFNVTKIEGAVRAGMAKWFSGVENFTDPANINQCLKESGLNDVRYTTEPLFGPTRVFGSPEIKRHKQVILERFDGYDWVKDNKSDLYFKDADKRSAKNEGLPLHERQPLIQRRASDRYLDIVGKEYKLHQPSQVFSVIHGAALKLDIEMAQAGIVNDGMTMFSRIDTGKVIHSKDARIPQFLLLLTGIGKCTKGGISQHDMACLNEWQSMIKNARWGLGSYHHGNNLPAENMLERMLVQATKNLGEQQRQIDLLVNTQVKPNDINDMIKNIMFDVKGDWELTHVADQDKRQRLLARNNRQFETLREIAKREPKVMAAGGWINSDARGTPSQPTAYGAFQSVVYLIDRQRTRGASGALSSNLTGTMQNRKQAALEMALDLAA
jgi:hypothetical protein